MTELRAIPSVKPTFERRFAAECRATAGRRLEGYAAVFNVETKIADFRETIRSGAFAQSLRSSDDILAMADHDPGKVLARTASKTLTLAEDAKGLHFSFEAPDTTAGNDMLALAKRGDLGGGSFAFRVRPNGERWEGRNRELLGVELLEISVVSAWPAYPQTEVTARARFPLRLARARRFLETV